MRKFVPLSGVGSIDPIRVLLAVSGLALLLGAALPVVVFAQQVDTIESLAHDSDAVEIRSEDGMIGFCETILGDVGRDATIIPGHGEITNGARLAETIEMLETVRERVARAMRAGQSRAEIIASKPTADLDARLRGQSDPDDFIDRVHASLVR